MICMSVLCVVSLPEDLSLTWAWGTLNVFGSVSGMAQAALYDGDIVIVVSSMPGFSEIITCDMRRCWIRTCHLREA
jgi:hypothetical protein